MPPETLQTYMDKLNNEKQRLKEMEVKLLLRWARDKINTTYDDHDDLSLQELVHEVAGVGLLCNTMVVRISNLVMVSGRTRHI